RDAEVGFLVLRDEMNQEFAVGRGLKDRTARFEEAGKFFGVCQIAIVGDSDVAAALVRAQRLRVAGHARAGCRITHMADRDISAQARKLLLGYDLADEALVFVQVEELPVVARDAGAFLASMLKGEEAKRRE